MNRCFIRTVHWASIYDQSPLNTKPAVYSWSNRNGRPKHNTIDPIQTRYSPTLCTARVDMIRSDVSCLGQHTGSSGRLCAVYSPVLGLVRHDGRRRLGTMGRGGGGAQSARRRPTWRGGSQTRWRLGLSCLPL